MPDAAGNPGKAIAGRFDGLCKISYEFALVLAVWLIVLIAVHRNGLQHINIDRTIDASHVAATVPHPDILKPGMSLPIYRFNPDWQEPIGKVQIDRVEGNQVTFSFDGSQFKWPMGKQGSIVAVENNLLRLNLGLESGLQAGQTMTVFDQRAPVGVLQVLEVGPTGSIGQLQKQVDRALVLDTLKGKVVSEYSVANQVVCFDQPLIIPIEILLTIAFIGGYLGLYFRWKKSPFLVAGPWVSAMLRIPSGARMAFHALTGLPTVWFLTLLSLQTVAYLSGILFDNLLHQSVPQPLTVDALRNNLTVLSVLFIVAYEWALFKYRKSPYLLIAKLLEFKGGVFRHTASEVPEHLTMWLFQVIILYAFGRTLGTFFQENFSQGIAASWPKAPPVYANGVNPVSLDGFGRTAHSIAYALTHAPTPVSQDGAVQTIQTTIFNACILGCLIGYGYSILGYLWGKRIRNVDFTFAGWATNAICYGPLLGAALWQVLPPIVGYDPNVTDGFIRTCTYVVAIILNVLYTLSIWNLGTLFGVMTDKGMRTTGFYSVVRHPSYTLEALMFIALGCRGFSSWGQVMAASSYLVIYWLRSEREDQFMHASNPDYAPYREKVPYKFFPGIY